MRMRTAGSVILLIALLTATVVGAATFSVAKWSGDTTLPVDPEADDGLVFDPENSYAWAMAEYGGYLYVGTNRNYMRQMFEQMSESGDLPGSLDEVFPEATDNAGKIYRKPLNGTGDWELFYDSPLVTVVMVPNPASPDVFEVQPDKILDYGYRTLEVYNGALYIVTYSFFDSPYSRVLKLPTTNGTSADLQEVFRVANQGGSGLRSIAAYNGALFIGTEDLFVWRNPSPPAQSPLTEPVTMTIIEAMGRQVPVTISPVGGKEGWEKVADHTSFPGVAYLAQETQGWGGLWDFLSYNGSLYASFADPVNGFSLYKTDGSSVTPTQTELWAWTPIVASQDLNPAAIYPQGLGNKQNTALTMTVFKDYAYAGTFSNWEKLIAYIMNGSGSGILRTWTPPQVYRFDGGDNWEMIVGDYKSTDRAANPNFTDPPLSGWRAGFYDNSAVTDRNYSTLRYVWRLTVHDDMLFLGTMDMMTVLEILAENVSDDLQEFVDSMHDANPNNPAGFDLYVTADGINIQAITRDGGFGRSSIFGDLFGPVGDRYNYGARTLVSASDGNLYLGTANPFHGCQAWRIGVEPEDGGEDDEDDNGGGGGGGGCTAIPAGRFLLLLLVPLGLFLGVSRKAK